MKKLTFLILFLIVATALVTAEGQYEAVKGLPQDVKAQSRWGAEIPADWKQFDESGDVKFFQVEHTAPASPAGHGSVLDGSLGERIVEVQAEPNIRGREVEWKLANKGPKPIWVVAGGMNVSKLNLKIEAGASSTFKMPVDSRGYAYLVVDNEGGGKTELTINAKIGDTGAKTARGKSMSITWF
jgi:hypothetical protein